MQPHTHVHPVRRASLPSPRLLGKDLRSIRAGMCGDVTNRSPDSPPYDEDRLVPPTPPPVGSNFPFWSVRRILTEWTGTPWSLVAQTYLGTGSRLR